jgi:hypothetical protein
LPSGCGCRTRSAGALIWERRGRITTPRSAPVSMYGTAVLSRRQPRSEAEPRSRRSKFGFAEQEAPGARAWKPWAGCRCTTPKRVRRHAGTNRR